MKASLYLFLAAGVLTLAGCSSTPTKVDSGPIRANTFNFVNNGTMPTANIANNDAKAHAMIQNAITKRLATSGVSRSTGLGDITVAYLILIADNASVTSINDYFGYGRDSMELADKAQSKFAVDNSNPNYFVAGTLVIDIIDSRTYKLLKRNFAVRPLQDNATDEARAARIQSAVDEALGDLEIKH